MHSISLAGTVVLLATLSNPTLLVSSRKKEGGTQKVVIFTKSGDARTNSKWND
jgi:hypothetical protein